MASPALENFARELDALVAKYAAAPKDDQLELAETIGTLELVKLGLHQRLVDLRKNQGKEPPKERS